MRKRYLVNLTVDERAALTQLVKRERVSGLKRLRASILLKADEGLTDQEIADDLEAGLVTVERVRKRCCERGLEAKHGSWLNIAEIFLSTLSAQCLDQRIGSIAALHTTVSAWQASRPNRKVNWRFTTTDARIKLRRLYPSIP